MVKLKKIISIISAITGIVITRSSGYNVYALNDSWKEDYLGVIANYSPETHPDAVFKLYYVNDDDVPELYVDTGYFAEGVKLYTYYDEQPVLCFEASYRCTLWLHSSKNGYFSDSYGVSAGYETFYNIIKLENGVCNKEYEFYHDGRIMADSTHDIYTINGEEVSQEEFESREEKMKAEYSLVSDYSDYINQDPANKYSYDEIYKYLSYENVSVDTTQPSSTPVPNETNSSVISSSYDQNGTLFNASVTTANKVADSKGDCPKTGDKGIIGIGAVLLSALGMFCILKKRQ